MLKVTSVDCVLHPVPTAGGADNYNQIITGVVDSDLQETRIRIRPGRIKAALFFSLNIYRLFLEVIPQKEVEIYNFLYFPRYLFIFFHSSLSLVIGTLFVY